MKRLEITIATGAAALAALASSPAQAEFWTPLDTVPRPNFIAGLDTSVTMGIRADCSSCHAPSDPTTRLNEAKIDLLNTLPMFERYFVFGGFEYSGCEYAKIETRVMPDPNDPPTSYNAVRSMISAVGHCPTRESYLPGGAASSVGCITPTTNCSGDGPIIQDILDGNVPGLSIPAPAVADPSANLACDTPSPPSPSYNLAASLLAKLGAGNFGWPRWTGGPPNAATVMNDLCTPLSNVLNQVNAELSACFTDPVSVWDLSFLAGGFGAWCTPGIIMNNACVPPSAFDGTCVCDATLSGCSSAAIPNTECNKPMSLYARQQVAVCEMYSTAQPSRLGSYYLSQPDNIANGQCRENVGLFLTDGWQGHRPWVAAEANDALNFYRSADGLSNMFVFRISNEFGSHANTMMSYVTNGQQTTAYLATDAATMQESFAKVLSRIYKGVYTGSSMGTDAYQTRAVFHSFTVPGYNASGPVSDDYLGFPSRISVHEIYDDGTIEPSPRFESDWADRVAASPGCGPFELRGPATNGTPPLSGGLDVTRLGPGGQFRNGVNRFVNVPGGTTDRDGDDMPDPHPALAYGRSFGFAAGEALVVDAPREANPGTEPGEIGDYIAFITDTDIQQRPRMIYYTDGGYLIGIHGGTYQAGAFSYGSQRMGFRYDDGGAPAGAEVLRYQPSWLNPAGAGNSGLSYKYTYGSNNLIQQPLMTGELIAKEARVRVGGADMYRTLLLGNQGKEGPGFFVLDVTDPCTPPAFATDIRLPPGNYASAEPTLYHLPMSTAPERRAALVTTGGFEGSSRMFAYDVVSGALIDDVSLPNAGGASYATAPTCVDVTGEGVVTHCYVLRSDGLLARVEVRTDGFGTVADITPVDGGGNTPTMAGGRSYYTSPVVYFGQDGAVNLVFGSGDFQNLTSPPVQNAVFKTRDPGTVQASVPAGAAQLDQVCRPDGGGNTHGVIMLPPGERVLSSPVVDSGVVAWSTYESTSNGCVAGSGMVYAMDFATCEDVMAPSSPRPSGTSVGAGIPTSPVLHRQSESLLVQSSAGPTGAQAMSNAARTRSGGQSWLKRLYWRLEVDNP